MSNTPSDADIVALAISEGIKLRTGAGVVRLARAVLAKWGTPQQEAPVADEFRPCPSCFGTGVEGDVDDYGRTIDVSCDDCNGSGRARVEAATEPDTAPSRYREACTQGGRCLGGCFITEPCYLTVREMARAALAAQGGK